MTKVRADIFDDDETPPLDLTGFAPKAGVDPKAPPPEQVRAVSQAAKFTSREPSTVTKPDPKVKATAKKREPRRHRTGRNVQLSVKASIETVDAFYAVTESQPGWVLGYTLQRAIEALQRELKQSK
jgi:hypothetical protein